MMKKSKRDITKRLRFNDEQAKRLDSYIQMKKFTFTDFTHSLIKSELDRLGWLCNENSPFDEMKVNTTVTHLPIRQRRREKFNLMGRVAPSVDPQLLRTLGGIGNNINQIARSLNLLCLQPLDVQQQFSFIDCFDVLADIQQQIHQYLPEIPKYTISEKLADHRRSTKQGSKEKVEYMS